MSISTLPATYTQILCETGNGILTITLNRPDRLNALTETMRDELIRAFAEADSNDDIRAVIVTGAGRAFCAGADLGRGGATFDHRARGGAPDPSQHRDGGGLVSLSSRCSQARAVRQSRFTVAGEMSSTAAVSAMVSPPK